MVESRKKIPELSPLFRQNLKTGAIGRITPLLISADLLLKSYEATEETVLLDEAQRLLEKYSNLAGASLM